MKDCIRQHARRGAAVIALAVLGMACTPEIQIRAPEEPIVINLNIKIEQEIRIRIDDAVEDLLLDEEGLF